MFQIIKRIFAIAGEEKKCLLWSMFFNLLESVMVFTPYMLLFYSLNQYLTGRFSMNTIKEVSIGMAGSIVFRCIFRRLVDSLQSTKGLNIFARQRLKFVEHLKKLPMGYYTEDNMGNIVSVLTTDLIFMEENVMNLMGQLVSSYISIVISFVFLLFFHTTLGVVYGVIIVVAYFAIKYLDQVNKEHGKIRQEQFGALSNSVVQFIKGLATVKAFGMKDEENVDLEKEFQTTKHNSLEFERKYLLPRLATDLSNTIGIAVIIITTILLYFYGDLSMDKALGMLIFSSICLHTLVALINGVPRFDILEAGLNRFDDIMSVEELKDTEQTLPMKNFDISFEDVHFSYDNKEIIKGVSFDIKENTFVALVGPSGGGKTTLTSLITRFWDVKKGRITLGGVDIREISLDTLLSNMSMVFQNVYLFQDTIANNIAFGVENASREEIMEAAKKARCHDFIMNMPNGYDTVIGEGGSTLSGGEKQRISIARAIMKDAPIVLLDEATSSVDPENELYIQEAINELVKNKTLIVIAHRLSSISEADKILVVEAGKITEAGNHQELIKNQKTYAKMWEYSASGMEMC